MRLFHPHLGREYDTGSDDPDHLQGFYDAGWQDAPEQVAKPGFEPEPTVYAPVVPDEPAVKAKRATKAEDKSTE